MQLHNRRWSRLAAMAALCCWTLESLADVPLTATITYAPFESTPVPGLSAAGVVLLAAALAIAGYFRLRRSNVGRFLSSILAVALASAVGSAGLLVARDAYAGVPSVLLTSPTGGTAPVYGCQENPVFNNTSVPLKITGIVAESKYFIDSQGAQHCVPGASVLLPNSANVCYVTVAACDA